MKAILSLILLASLAFGDMASLWNEATKNEKYMLLIGVSLTTSYVLNGKVEESQRGLVDCIEYERFIPLVDVIYSRKKFKNVILPNAIELAAMLEKTNISELEKMVVHFSNK